MFESYNRTIWPMQFVACGLAAFVLWAIVTTRPWNWRAAAIVLSRGAGAQHKHSSTLDLLTRLAHCRFEAGCPLWVMICQSGSGMTTSALPQNVLQNSH